MTSFFVKTDIYLFCLFDDVEVEQTVDDVEESSAHPRAALALGDGLGGLQDHHVVELAVLLDVEH